MLFRVKRTFTGQAAAVTVLALLAWLFFSISRRIPSIHFGWRDMLPLMACIFLSGLADGCITEIHLIVLGKKYLAQICETLNGLYGHLSLPGAIGGGLVAGVGEELLFRGALQPIVGLIGAAALFAAAHMWGRGLLRLLPWTFLEGLLFGALYQWTGNLFYPMVVHGVHDTVAILVIAQLRARPEGRLAALASRYHSTSTR